MDEAERPDWFRLPISLELIQDAPEMAEQMVRGQLPPGDWKLAKTVPAGLRWDGEPDYSSPLYDPEFGDWDTDTGEPVYLGPREWKHTQEVRTYVRNEPGHLQELPVTGEGQSG